MAERPHGYARYRLDGCRCYTCGFAVSEYERRRQKAIATGTWKPFVDAAPVRAHLAALAAAGVGYKRAAGLAGVSKSAVAALLFGKRGRPPSDRIRAETAAALLAVGPDLDAPADGALVDAAGTRRRVEGLAALGWSLSVQARRIGWTTANYATLLKASRINARTARAVAALYGQLSMTIPPEGYSSTRTRRWATAQGFLPPLAWDDDTIDDPHAQPQLGVLDEGEDADEGVVWLALHGHLSLDELTPAERAVVERHRRDTGQQRRAGADMVEEYLRLRDTEGLGREAAARRMGVRVTTLHAALHRARVDGDDRVDFGRRSVAA